MEFLFQHFDCFLLIPFDSIVFKTLTSCNICQFRGVYWCVAFFFCFGFDVTAPFNSHLVDEFNLLSFPCHGIHFSFFKLKVLFINRFFDKLSLTICQFFKLEISHWSFILKVEYDLLAGVVKIGHVDNNIPQHGPFLRILIDTERSQHFLHIEHSIFFEFISVHV